MWLRESEQIIIQQATDIIESLTHYPGEELDNHTLFKLHSLLVWLKNK